jgi:hypothetical protein
MNRFRFAYRVKVQEGSSRVKKKKGLVFTRDFCLGEKIEHDNL